MEFAEFKSNFAILIVDDNEDNVFTLQSRLQRDGYNNLFIAKDGLEALAVVETEKIHLVLLDIMMPGMSGCDVLAKWKDKIIGHKLSVLMISSADNLENIIDSIKMGADDFLSKPFNPHILRARIGSSVEKHWHLYQAQLYKDQIERERRRYFAMLNAVFPSSIVKEMTETGIVKPKSLKGVVIIFADVVGFTHYTETHEPEEIVKGLEHFIGVCESAALKHGIEKIKTIGDSFMAAGNMLETLENPVLVAVKWSQEVIAQMQNTSSAWEIRVGIDVGDVVCGIIGNREYLFDVWGNCVNTASRVQNFAQPNDIYLTEQAWLKIAGLEMKEKLVGEFTVKGKELACKLYKI